MRKQRVPAFFFTDTKQVAETYTLYEKNKVENDIVDPNNIYKIDTLSEAKDLIDNSNYNKKFKDFSTEKLVKLDDNYINKLKSYNYFMKQPGINERYIDSLKDKYAVINIDSKNESDIVIKKFTPRDIKSTQYLVGDENTIKDLVRDYLYNSENNLPNIYKTYLNAKNPLIIDAKGNLFNNIIFENQKYTLNEFSGSNKLIDLAQERGYDSIIINNVIDIGDNIKGNIDKEPHTVVAVFNSNQIKDYRNTNPTKNNDIRYSLSEDSKGRKLSEGQIERNKNVSNEALDEQGRLKVFYHGTPIGTFNSFNENSYFTDIKEYADTYQNPIASSNSVLAKYTEEQAPKTYEVYLTIEKPFNIANDNERNIFINEYVKGGNALSINPYLNDYSDINKIDWTEGDNLKEFLDENYPGQYDSIIINEGGNENGTQRGMSVAVLDPTIIKNVDNINPTDSNDIRYSLNDNPYQNEGNEREKSFVNTATESDILNEENKQAINEEKVYNGTYIQRTNDETRNAAIDIINNSEGNTINEKLENAYRKFKDGTLSNTGLDTAVATELVKQYQSIGENQKAVDIVWEMDNLAREQGRSIQYLNAWKALQPEGKIQWLKRTVENYNANDRNKTKINFTQETADEMLQQFKQLDTLSELQNETNKEVVTAALENVLLDNARFNNNTERMLAENILDSLDLSVDEIKDKIISERMMQVLNQGDVSFWKKVNTAQTISHLLNTSTASRNLLSNEAMWAIDKIARKVGGFVTGNRIVGTTVDNKVVREKAKAKAKEVSLDIWLGIDGLSNTKYNNSTSKNINGIVPTFKSNTFNALEKLLGQELKVPDENMKEKVRETIKQQYKKALGDDYAKYETEINDYADQEALYITFQDSTLISETMQTLKQLANKVSFGNGEFGLGDLLIKYTQVPGNIVSRTIEYSPYGVAKGLANMIKTEIAAKQGKISLTERNKAIVDLGRGLTGTAIMALGALLAKMGWITGNKDENEAITQLLKDAGVTDGEINMSQIYRTLIGENDGTIKDGDKLVSFDWLQPVSMTISSGAVLYNSLKNGRGANTIADVTENFLDLPCNQSLSTIMQAWQYGYGDAEKGTGTAVLYGALQAGGDSLAGFIPSMVRQVANAVDPVSRNTYSRGDVLNQTKKKIINNIPVASKTLEPNIKADGTEKKYYDAGFLFNLMNQMLPGRRTNVSYTEGTEQIKSILQTSDGKSLAKASNMPLRYAPNKTTYIKETDENGKEVGIKLNDKQKTIYMKAYSEYYRDNYLTYVNKRSDAKTDKQKEKIAEQMQKLQTAAKKYAEKKALEK